MVRRALVSVRDILTEARVVLTQHFPGVYCMGQVYSDYSVVLFPEAHDIGLFSFFKKRN